eukprot:5194104-Prymnesium_polylepis.1
MLNLDCCAQLHTLEGLQHCPQLELLQLHSCTGLLMGVPPLSGSIHVRLRALHLGGTYIKHLAPLAGCPLMHLNIDRCPAVLVEAVHHFPTLTRLHGMRIKGWMHLEPFRALQSLERLDVRLSDTLSDLGALADCTALRHLCVLGCTKVSHLDALAGCERLTSLDLTDLTRLTIRRRHRLPSSPGQAQALRGHEARSLTAFAEAARPVRCSIPQGVG